MPYAIHGKRRLEDVVESDFDRASNHRAARERIWRAYIGDSHGLSETGADRIPLNGHALLARSMIQYLAAHQPKLMISTDVGPWKAHMESVEYQGSRVMREEKFGFKQQRWVLDALMYSPGMIAVFQEWRRVPQGDEGDYAEILKTAVANIDFSDWLWDLSASSVHDCAYTGFNVRRYVEDIIANPMFGNVDAEALRGSAGYELHDNERLFFENADTSQPYRDCVTLRYVWDRCDNRIRIWPASNPNLKLYDEPWDGHANGPLHYIDYLDVPNHVVGLSPMSILYDLFEATNRALSKTIKQTDAAKTVMVVDPAHKAEAEAIMEALDGTAVYASSAPSQMMSVGGPDGRTMAMVPVLKDLANWLGGNINELAGLGVSAPTATQGKLLNEAASGMVKFMQARTQEAVRTACEAIVHQELKDTIGTESVPTPLADGQTYWKKFTPEQRSQIDAILVNVDIDVFSMHYKSPSDRLQTIMQWWTQVAVPGYQIWQAQGGEYDMQALNRNYAKMVDEPIINEIALYSMQPKAEGTGNSPVAMRQSPVTTRTNVRMDRGGPSGELGGEMAANLASRESAA